MNLDINRIRIDIDDGRPDRVWIYMLNAENEPVEGAEFDLSEFMNCILQFYNQNY
tara:strand:- start:471 stop:635 length:165 start_codon:yes stop_codon:yes gene_type:complete